jgi:hypothetical protein
MQRKYWCGRLRIHRANAELCNLRKMPGAGNDSFAVISSCESIGSLDACQLHQLLDPIAIDGAVDGLLPSLSRVAGFDDEVLVADLRGCSIDAGGHDVSLWIHVPCDAACACIVGDGRRSSLLKKVSVGLRIGPSGVQGTVYVGGIDH